MSHSGSDARRRAQHVLTKARIAIDAHELDHAIERLDDARELLADATETDSDNDD